MNDSTGQAAAAGMDTDLEGVERVPRTESGSFADGIASGRVGATLIAVFFLFVDLAEGRPFWTPGVIGTALFLGEELPPGEAPLPVIVFAYTLMHGVVLIAAGAIAAVALRTRHRALDPLLGLGLAAAIFAALEIFFMPLAWTAAPALIDEVGAGSIALANILAAGGMAAVLLRRRHGVAVEAEVGETAR